MLRFSPRTDLYSPLFFLKVPCSATCQKKDIHKDTTTKRGNPFLWSCPAQPIFGPSKKQGLPFLSLDNSLLHVRSSKQKRGNGVLTITRMPLYLVSSPAAAAKLAAGARASPRRRRQLLLPARHFHVLSVHPLPTVLSSISLPLFCFGALRVLLDC